MTDKQCPKCKRLLPISNFQKSLERKDGLQAYCKDCRKETARGNATVIKYCRDYRKTERYKKWLGRYKNKNIKRMKEIAYLRKRKLRDDALEKYGGACECCGEKEKSFLVIDHINGGGSQHRKKLKGGSAIYYWLKKHKYPPGYRVLCCNCNWGIYMNGVCPHQEKNSEEKVAEKRINHSLKEWED